MTTNLIVWVPVDGQLVDQITIRHTVVDRYRLAVVIHVPSI